MSSELSVYGISYNKIVNHVKLIKPKDKLNERPKHAL